MIPAVHHPKCLRRISLLFLAVCTAGAPSGWSAERPKSDPAAGQAAYQQSCARCHGVDGKGDGVDAKRFYPRPRDLSLGVYKFRSTASGTPPSDDDLYRTITHGLPGSNMPDWVHLDEATRWHLVDYLKSLAPVFEQTQPAPVTLTPDPGPKKADLEKGKALFTQLGCVACHGALGRANGPSAAGLVDDWGMSIMPADLTQGWGYRGGRDAHAIAMRLTAGIDGAGMPSYAEAISPEDTWHLSYYVASLQEPAHWNMVAHPMRLKEGELPTAVDDPRWEHAEQTDVRLRNVVTPAGEWATPPTVRAVTFRAILNHESMAVRVSWDDPSESRGKPSDGLALVFKPDGLEGDLVTLHAWPYAGAPALDVCYWTSDTGRKALETVVADFDSVVSGQSKRSQVALAHAATYADGRWHVVLTRPLKPAGLKGVATLGEEFRSMAFAVWDGGNAGTRAVSPWIDLSFQDSRSH